MRHGTRQNSAIYSRNLLYPGNNVAVSILCSLNLHVILATKSGTWFALRCRVQVMARFNFLSTTYSSSQPIRRAIYKHFRISVWTKAPFYKFDKPILPFEWHYYNPPERYITKFSLNKYSTKSWNFRFKLRFQLCVWKSLSIMVSKKNFSNNLLLRY